ncbi:MAG: NAD(P)H-quinone oxidoreductase [Alphaproteobacteria bacterium]|nr:NAD(P)H-quinone oxidoreductase [Alphaproteobacteria bacterium]HCP00876.1 NAD(P)H-quinone oxidoreductase [Rhodospirillaceae bacterium]
MVLPDVMRAIEISKPGGPEVLKPTERPVPVPRDGEVLIRVCAAGVNRPDLAQRKGVYPAPPGASDLPGLEVAGEIVALGENTSEWKTGNEACALVSGGGYAEYVAVPGSQTLPIPEGLDMIQAAGVPETFFTVWANVFDRGRFRPGERFLVHGGSSGIGTTAIQLCKAFGAAAIFTTVGTVEKAAFCEKLGATRAINYKKEAFEEVVVSETDGEGVDVILDMVGGDYTPRNIAALRPDGRIAQIALMGGTKAEINLAKIMMNRITLTGSTLRPQSVTAKAAIAASLREKVWPLFASGALAPVIHATFPLDDAPGAHQLMETSNHIGKIILEVS